MTYSGKNILILGLGKSGLSSALLLHRLGASVSATDSKKETEIPPTFLAQLKEKSIPLEAGKNSEESLKGKDLVVVSPGVPADAPLLLEAKKRGIEIISEVELAYRLTEVPIIAVTGTNGKTTTTTLVSELLKSAGKKVLLGGNIGTPLTQSCQEKADYIVAEISSFQMEYSPTFRACVAIFLNFTDDHLYRHGTRESYFQQKMKLFLNQTAHDHAVLNQDDEWVNRISTQIPSQCAFFSRKEKVQKGAFLENGVLKIASNGVVTDILPAQELFIKGNHNIENGLAALCAAALCQVPPEIMRQVLRSFKGVPHRLEWVADLDGVNYYNDSKGTNGDSTIKALEAFDRPIRLILGGVDKGGDLSPLIQLIHQKVIQVLLIGESSPLYREKLKNSGYTNFIETQEMASAVAEARKSAKPGEIVLLSPACASFDQYKNYEERGEHFKSLVRKLETGDRRIGN